MTVSARARQLYKQIIWVGRDYPGGLDVVRNKAKPQFFAMAHEQDPEKLEAAYKKTEWIIKELENIYKFHKYRQLRKRYNDNDQTDKLAHDRINAILKGEANKHK